MNTWKLVRSLWLVFSLPLFQAAQAADEKPATQRIDSTETLCWHAVNQMNHGSGASLKDYFSQMGFYSRMTNAISYNRKAVDEILPKMRSFIADRQWFLSMNDPVVQWRIVRFTPGDHEDTCTVITLPNTKSGLIIADLYLAQEDNGPAIVDTRQYMLNLRSSDFFARMLLESLLPAWDANRKNLEAMTRAIQSNDFPKANSIYLALSPEAKRNPLMQQFYLSAGFNSPSREDACKVDDNLLANIDHPEQYPLLLLDSTLYHNNLVGTLTALDSIEKNIGRNTALDLLRLETYLATDTPGDAAYYRYAADLLDRDDGISASYWVLLKQTIRDKRYSDSITILDILKEKFGLTLDTDKLKTVKHAKEFEASPEFKAWQKLHKENT